MKTKFLSALIGLGCFIQPLFAQDAATNAAPVIPETAREHFVMGTTLYSNATSVADFKQAADEFQQAADLAPQWSKPRYNLAWAKEAAEDYAGAIADLKRYQQFNLPEAEARAVQDKIYVIKAKLAKAEKKQADKRTEEERVEKEQAAATEKAQQDALKKSFVGHWRFMPDTSSPCRLKIRLDTVGVIHVEQKIYTGKVFIPDNVRIEGDTMKYSFDIEDGNNQVTYYVELTPGEEGILKARTWQSDYPGIYSTGYWWEKIK